MTAKLIKSFDSKNIYWYFNVNEHYRFRFDDGDFFIKDKNGNERLCLNEIEFIEYFDANGEALRKIRRLNYVIYKRN